MKRGWVNDVRRDCRCGASYRGSSLPPQAAEAIGAAFDAEHTGEGHGPATPAQAARARARADTSTTASETTP